MAETNKLVDNSGNARAETVAVQNKSVNVAGTTNITFDTNARFVTGAWSTQVDAATRTMPSEPTFSRGL